MAKVVADHLEPFGTGELASTPPAAADTDAELPPLPKPIPVVVSLVAAALADPSNEQSALPEQLTIPGYEILDRLGRGGMGVVYKARQEKLNRVVALKVLLHLAHSGTQELRRFHSEAEAVAQLQHPHIVQIYEIGEHSEIAFLTLEFLDGGNLAQRLAGRPQPPRQAAQLVETLAQAMQFAHERGIVHRDLKPSNVLLTREGIPKVADFGLAKQLAPRASAIALERIEEPAVLHGPMAIPTAHSAQASSDRAETPGAGLDREEPSWRQTRSGMILGTPSYMAPEQADGKVREIGPAADVYALGAILYEMLTGRPPFRGITSLDTLRQVQSQEPVRPSRLQTKMPRDLETICLKCLEKQPRQRYTSARALADDLQRFLAGEPIHGRPTPIWERAVKWVRRRPATAVLAAVSVLTAATGAGGMMWHNAVLRQAATREADQARSAKVSRDIAELKSAEADEQRRRAEANFLKARQAADKLTEVVSEHLVAEPRSEQVRRELLLEVLRIYQGFLDENSTDPVIQNQTARAYARAANILGLLDQHDQAENFYRQAIRLLDALTNDLRDTLYWREVGHSHSELSVLLATVGRHREAEEAGRKAIEVFEQLTAQCPEIAQHRHDQATGYIRLAAVLQQVNRADESEQSLRNALTVETTLVDEFPAEAPYRAQLATAHNNLGGLLENRQSQSAAEEHYCAALEHYKKLRQEFPANTVYARNLAAVHMSLGKLWRRDRRTTEAETAFRDAIALLDLLTADYPKVVEYRSLLGGCYGSLAYLLKTTQRTEEAAAAWRRALDLKQRVVDESPNVADYRSSLGAVQNDLAMLLSDRGDPANARQLLEQAIEHQRAALELNPQNVGYRRFLRNHYGALAETTLRQHDHVRAAEAAGDLVRIFPDRWEEYRSAAGVLARASVVAAIDESLPEPDRRRIAQQDADQAVQFLNKAVQLGFKDVKYLVNRPDFDSLRTRDDFQRLLADLAQPR